MKKSPVVAAPQHASYQMHRRQFWIQIMLPVLLGALLVVIAPIALWIARMGGAGDVGRWAAISTMWLLLPVIVGLILWFIVLVVAIYLAGWLGAWLPAYSLRAQKLASTVAVGTRRGAEIVRKPLLGLRAIGNAATAGIRRLRERA